MHVKDVPLSRFCVGDATHEEGCVVHCTFNRVMVGTGKDFKDRETVPEQVQNLANELHSKGIGRRTIMSKISQ
jgi:hypothetical protein